MEATGDGPRAPASGNPGNHGGPVEPPADDVGKSGADAPRQEKPPDLRRAAIWILTVFGSAVTAALIRLQVDHLPGDRNPKPVWLWSSATGAAPGDVDRLWQAFLRRFD